MPRICRPRDHITAELVRNVLHYEPTTGVFTWLVDHPRRRYKAGDVAGCFSDGRNRIGLARGNGKVILASILAWLYMTGEWPTDQIDHKNKNRSDDRWENLRLATHSQNNVNKEPTPDKNKTGYTAVYHQGNKFRAQIRYNGKRISLGTFDTAEDAFEAYKIARNKISGEFSPYQELT